MSVEPLTKTWEFDDQRFIPVAKSLPQSNQPNHPQSSPPDDGNFFGFIAFLFVLAAGISGVSWLTGNAYDAWNVERENTARTELAAIKKCLGGN